jgi:excisionase family DNA binding protein
MKYSASKAAEAVGKSVPTITRAIKSGKLSAEKLDGGGYEIDAAELHRVWPAVTGKDDDTPAKLGRETPNETAVLQVKLEAKDELLTRVERELADMKEQRDKWQSQCEAQQRLLEAPKPEPATLPFPRAPRGLWARLMGHG